MRPSLVLLALCLCVPLPAGAEAPGSSVEMGKMSYFYGHDARYLSTLAHVVTTEVVWHGSEEQRVWYQVRFSYQGAPVGAAGSTLATLAPGQNVIVTGWTGWPVTSPYTHACVSISVHLFPEPDSSAYGCAPLTVGVQGTLVLGPFEPLDG